MDNLVLPQPPGPVRVSSLLWPRRCRAWASSLSLPTSCGDHLSRSVSCLAAVLLWPRGWGVDVLTAMHWPLGALLLGAAGLVWLVPGFCWLALTCCQWAATFASRSTRCRRSAAGPCRDREQARPGDAGRQHPRSGEDGRAGVTGQHYPAFSRSWHIFARRVPPRAGLPGCALSAGAVLAGTGMPHPCVILTGWLLACGPDSQRRCGQTGSRRAPVARTCE
jgi:hypothetical protein